MIVFNKSKNIAELDINSEIGLDNSTRPIGGLPDPMIESCFLDNTIFVNLFHTRTLTMYHFSYNYLQQKIIGDPQKTQLDHCTINFPIKSFYDDEKERIYCFFRQGQSFTINPKRPSHVQKQQIWDFDLGQMYLINNNILMVKSSCEIIFFRLEPKK